MQQYELLVFLKLIGDSHHVLLCDISTTFTLGEWRNLNPITIKYGEMFAKVYVILELVNLLALEWWLLVSMFETIKSGL